MDTMRGPDAGWYDGGVTPGVLRWFDGDGWTEHTSPQPPAPPVLPAPPAYPVPVGQAVAYGFPGPGAVQPAYGYPAPVAQRQYEGSSPTDAMHWIVPVGRSWQSIVAGYLGLVALVVWPLAPFAIGLGIWALVRARQGGHGRGRAVFALVCGTLGLVVGALVLGSGMLAGA